MGDPIPPVSYFVYVGRRGYDKSSQRDCYYQLSGWPSAEAKREEKLLTFVVKRKKSLVDVARPGAVFAIPVAWEADGRGTFWFGKSTYEGRWFDEAQVLSWAAEDKACRTTVSMLAAKKKLASACSFEDALEPIRLAYQAEAPMNKAAMLAAVIRFITG